MRIFLPFTITGIGGTATFARKFQEGMRKRGHEIFFEHPGQYDILFLIVQAPFKYLIEAKRQGKPIIQRLDGTYYWSVAKWKYPFYNLKAGVIRHLFADFTVYQSKYSKLCAEKFLGKKRGDPSAIIYNGVNLDTFSPKGSKINLRDNQDQKIFFTASAFRRTDQIVPIIEAAMEYRKQFGDNFKLVIAGTFSGRAAEIPTKYDGFKNVVFLGKIANEELPEYERSADVFLFTHLNPPCPNNVIEAMGCGLPICGVADGAMPELVENQKNALLISVFGDAFWKNRVYDIHKFADNINTIIRNRETFSKGSVRIARERFPLDSMLDHYEQVFQNLLK